jgi:hypothetical protein
LHEGDCCSHHSICAFTITTIMLYTLPCMGASNACAWCWVILALGPTLLIRVRLIVTSIHLLSPLLSLSAEREMAKAWRLILEIIHDRF